MRSCLAVLHTRFLVSQPTFVVKIASARGVEVLDLGAADSAAGAAGAADAASA